MLIVFDAINVVFVIIESRRNKYGCSKFENVFSFAEMSWTKMTVTIIFSRATKGSETTYSE